MTSVPQTSKGPSLRQPSTTPADSFSQTSQHLKISAKQAINNERSIRKGLNIRDVIGKLGLMWLHTYATHHCEKPLLQPLYTQGCPVICGPAWSTEEIESAIIHGPHMLAKSIESRTALRSEAHTKVQNGFAKILKYTKIKNRLPPTLEVYPEVCIPHKICQYRVILDLYSRLYVNGKYLSSVKNANPKTAPQRVNGPARINTEKPRRSHGE